MQTFREIEAVFFESKMEYRRKTIDKDAALKRLDSAIEAGKVRCGAKQDGEAKLGEVLNLICGIKQRSLRNNVWLLIGFVSIECNGQFETDIETFADIFQVNDNMLAEMIITLEHLGIAYSTSKITSDGDSTIMIEASSQYFRYK